MKYLNILALIALLTSPNVFTQAQINDEGFEKISIQDRKENEVDLMNAQILINDEQFHLAKKLINHIIEDDPSFEEPYSTLYRYYQSKGKVIEKLTVLEEAVFSLNKRQDLLNIAPGKISKNALKHILNLITNHLMALRRYPDKKDFHYEKGRYYLKVIKNQNYRPYSYHLYSALYDFENSNALSGFINLSKSKNRAYAVTDGLYNTALFYEGLHMLKNGRTNIGVKTITKVKAIAKEEKIINSANKMIDIYLSPSFSAYAAYSRIINSNVSGLPEEKRSVNDLNDINEGGHSNQVFLGMNLSNISLFKNSIIFTDPELLILQTKQEKKAFEGYTHRFYLLGLKIRPRFSSNFIPYAQYNYSSLYLNQLNQQSEYKISHFSYNHTLSFIWNIPSIYGFFELGLNGEKNTEVNTDINDSYTYGLNTKFNLWKSGAYLNPYLNLGYSYEKFPKGGLPNEQEYSFNIGNDIKLDPWIFKLEPSIKLTETQGISETEYKLSARLKILYNFRWRKIKGNYNLTYQQERRKKNDPVEFVNRTSLKFGILIAY